MQLEIREITHLAIVLRILVAVIMGGLLGLERGLKNRPAGMRTYMLVCTGACIVMLTNQYVCAVLGGEPTRLAAQVVSGIGFLGAGTIIVTRHSQIKGLTTAAGLWSSACVGIALGIGFYEAALVGGLATFVVMTMLQRMDNRVHRKTKQIEIYFELDSETSLGDFLRLARSRGMELSALEREHGGHGDAPVRCYTATLKVPQRQTRDEILDQVRENCGVVWAEEI